MSTYNSGSSSGKPEERQCLDHNVLKTENTKDLIDLKLYINYDTLMFCVKGKNFVCVIITISY